MYDRENIDPRFIGLHVHHRSVRMLKTQQYDPVLPEAHDSYVDKEESQVY